MPNPSKFTPEEQERINTLVSQGWDLEEAEQQIINESLEDEDFGSTEE